MQQHVQSDKNQVIQHKKIDQKITVEPQKKGKSVKKVSVLGLGYIGLPTAIVLAEHGYDVTGVDINQELVNNINQADSVICEPQVYEKLHLVLGAGTFRAATKINSADYFVIAVPTPLKQDKKADLSYVFAAAQSIASVLQKGNVIILESTVPVGATKQLAQFLADKTGFKAGQDFFVAHCPERVLPGNIFYELIHNDRIIGGINRASVDQAKCLYKKFVQGCLYLTDAQSAEMVKLVENASRDVQIAFANQVGSMAASLGLNPYDIIELANKHPRVNILKPTSGVGGHCIAVDPWFLVESFPSYTQLLKQARQINDARPKQVVASIQTVAQQWKQKHSKPCTVLLLGLTYKPNVDDLRESPALAIAQQLVDDTTMQVLISEPHVNSAQLHNMFGDRIVSTTDGIARADVVAYLVGHQRFSVVDQRLLAGKKILDFCGILYEQHNQSDEREVMFWPARSMLDFFIANQQPVPAGAHEVQVKETGT